MVRSSKFFFQLNEGEQLYASSFPGYFAWIGLCKSARLLDVGMRSFAPDQVGVGRVGKAARNGRVETSADAEKSLRRCVLR